MSGVVGSPEVAVVWAREPFYPTSPPFHPSTLYPEYRWGREHLSSEPNPVYDSIRILLSTLGLDLPRYGHPDWNPLRELVRPGDCVLIKPNLICEGNWGAPQRWLEVITHPAVVRAVIDFTLIALNGNGRILIADGPQLDSDLDLLLERTGYGQLVAYYRAQGIPVGFLDLRPERWIVRGGITETRIPLTGDPLGTTTVELGQESAFIDYPLSGRYYGADYDIAETRSFHSDGRHAYVLCRSPLAADVVINLPKLKTHKKTGVTISLKNLVGTVGLRNCLPHHTIGAPRAGGDEFPNARLTGPFESRSIRLLKRVLLAQGGKGGPLSRFAKRAGSSLFGDTDRIIRSGNWEGNDTAWRMVLDLNRALLWHDSAGVRTERPRRYLALVDGIVAGEGNGPLSPTPVTAGVLLAGTNPWALDWVGAHVMGFSPERIRLLAAPLAAPDRFRWLLPAAKPIPLVAGAPPNSWHPFVPHFGWPSLAQERPPRLTGDGPRAMTHGLRD